MVPATRHVDYIEVTRQDAARRRLRRVCQVSVLILAALNLWLGRFALDADGLAYIDVARAWLRGDWPHALNPYWSPLYIWLLTVAFGIVHPSMHWLLPLVHAVNFVEFIAAFAASEWLSREWEHFQGPPAHPLLVDFTRYCLFLWASLRLTNLWLYNNADTSVMALLIAATAILIRIRREERRNREFAWLGIVLGIGFLAKTALATVIPVFLLVVAVLLRSRSESWLDRRILITASMVVALVAPWVTAISIANGRFTVGDSGWLNYSWHVTGMSVEGYKESAYSPGPEIPHPIRVLMQHPRVLSFDQHVVGTYPIHAEISWWCQGYPVRFDKARQLMILWSNIVFSIYAFRCPSVLLLLIALAYGAPSVFKRLFQAWFIWVPSLFLALTYCFVYSDYRYLAGNYALIGFALIAASWKTELPRRVAAVAAIAIPLFTWLTMGTAFRHIMPQIILETAGKEPPWGYLYVEVAEKLHNAGLRPGDRVAYIGWELAATHIGVARAQIVSVIPERIYHDDTRWGRPYAYDFSRADEFWRSNQETNERVFGAFRRVGAKWVVADNVPQWADLRGWQIAGSALVLRPAGRPYTYLRKLQ